MFTCEKLHLTNSYFLCIYQYFKKFFLKKFLFQNFLYWNKNFRNLNNLYKIIYFENYIILYYAILCDIIYTNISYIIFLIQYRIKYIVRYRYRYKEWIRSWKLNWYGLIVREIIFGARDSLISWASWPISS